MWKIEKIRTSKFLTLNSLYKYLNITFIFMKSNFIVFNKNSIINLLINLIPLRNQVTKTVKLKYNYNNYNVKNNITHKTHFFSKNQNLFKLYTTILSQSTTSIQTIHPSQKFNFFKNENLNINIYNLSKLSNKWLNITNLFYNLFFYEIPLLCFSTSLFKKELLSLNWKLNKNLHSYWKLIEPSFYMIKNKILNNEFLLFNYLSKRNYQLAFIFDVLFHQKTLFFLKRNQFYTIGLIPLQYNLNLVNFSIPVSTSNSFNNIFFLRLLIYIQKQTSYQKLCINKNLWYTSINL